MIELSYLKMHMKNNKIQQETHSTHAKTEQTAFSDWNRKKKCLFTSMICCEINLISVKLSNTI